MKGPGSGQGHIHQEATRIATTEPDGDLEGLCRLEYRRLQSFLDEDLADEVLKGVQEQVRLSLGIAEQAIARYSLNHLCLSYNGGKDCLVLLVIYLAAIHAHHKAASREASVKGAIASQLPPKLRAIYILPPHQFPEVDAFVQTSAEHYQLQLASSSKPMKEAFAEYLEAHTEIKAIFVGTRRTDPHGGGLKHFDPTDRGWPSFMRIHPVIDWHYREIWAFIKHLNLPYCSLYDLGYTSLGGTNDTAPNPKLQVQGQSEQFLPAYTLQDDEEERLGRARDA